ncbi:MAG: hypothetical protein QOH13_2255, partial [Thermoleophilaceae bacterium]|nr:hypothetical protein [Thermoleophilaceae bacterium]
LHVSIPNARYFSAAYDLVVRGTFGYSDEGIRDATHLRWFTRRDIVALLAATGWPVLSSTGAYGPRVARALRLTRGLGVEFVSVQWTVLAQRPPEG